MWYSLRALDGEFFECGAGISLRGENGATLNYMPAGGDAFFIAHGHVS
jgi:hypothetical protein